jgi:hypothetical protein
MVVEVEDVDLAFPYGLAVEGFRDGYDFAETGGAAVLGFSCAGKRASIFDHFVGLLVQ